MTSNFALYGDMHRNIYTWMTWIFFILDLETELPMFSKIKAVSEIKGSFSLMHNGIFWIQWFLNWTDWFCST